MIGDFILQKKIGSQRGFSLIELIIAIAIIAVLVGATVPQLMKYIKVNRTKACQIDREGILTVYERCVYAGTLEISDEDLNHLLNGDDVVTKDEVFQYKNCPEHGVYSGKIIGNKAYIYCSHVGHDPVVIDFSGWTGVDLPEVTDEPFATPTPIPTNIPTPTPIVTPTPTPTPPTDKGLWPYDDDTRWDGMRFPGQMVVISVPTGLFTSKDGNTYVIIDKDRTGKYTVYYEWSLGPENIDTRGWESCISYSGVTITDIDSIRIPGTKNQITGVNYGDIIVYGGKSFIYASHYDGYYKDLPTNGISSNNFYLVGP